MSARHHHITAQTCIYEAKTSVHMLLLGICPIGEHHPVVLHMVVHVQLELLLLLCSQKYDITLVSPRNYFLYTPLLPAVCTGTVEERSIVEPIRRIMAGKVAARTQRYQPMCTVHMGTV